MNVAIFCETSGEVRDAFLKKGHNAWSFDIDPVDKGVDNFFHIEGDVRKFFNRKNLDGANRLDTLDLIIAHPPCTYLANSGVQWLHGNEERSRDLLHAVWFFEWIVKLPVAKICIENPIPHKYGIGHRNYSRYGFRARKDGKPYSQIIQPWQFGYKESKATCLWLKGLPDLKPTRVVGPPPTDPVEKKKWHKVHNMAPSATRGKERSVTCHGIALAMANQWG